MTTSSTIPPTTHATTARDDAPITLAEPRERGVVPIALNLLEGAAQVTRARQLGLAGLHVPAAAVRFRPRRLC